MSDAERAVGSQKRELIIKKWCGEMKIFAVCSINIRAAPLQSLLPQPRKVTHRVYAFMTEITSASKQNQTTGSLMINNESIEHWLNFNKIPLNSSHIFDSAIWIFNINFHSTRFPLNIFSFFFFFLYFILISTNRQRNAIDILMKI